MSQLILLEQNDETTVKTPPHKEKKMGGVQPQSILDKVETTD